MNNSYQKLLVAVDGSVNAQIAFKEAVKIAKNNQAKLVILQVINTQGDIFSKLVIESEREDGLLYLESLKKQATDQNFENIELILEEGSAKQLIAKTIPERENVDLIIIGATGKHGIEKVLGATTHYVVSHSDKNVLIVK